MKTMSRKSCFQELLLIVQIILRYSKQIFRRKGYNINQHINEARVFRLEKDKTEQITTRTCWYFTILVYKKKLMAENEYQSNSKSMRLVQKVFTIGVHSTCTNPVLEETLSDYAQIISFSTVDTISVERRRSENEIVLIIISDNEPILHQLDALEKVHSIFIYSSNNSSQSVESFQEQFRKFKGIFVDISLLSRRILLQIKRDHEDFIPITVLPSGSLFLEHTDLDHLDPSFMYIKLFKDIFMDVTYTKEARTAFIDYYRTTFTQNEATKKMLDVIENCDDRKTLIRQYTSASSLFGLLNQAIRHMDVEVLPLMGFFIHALCWELEELYWNSGISDREKIVVYRGQM